MIVNDRNEEIDPALIEKMNDELDLYIPEGIEGEAVFGYENLFLNLRKMYYLGNASKELIADYFAKFYHADSVGRSELLTITENEADYYKRQLEDLQDDEIDNRSENLANIYQILNHEGKVKLLYNMDHGGEDPFPGADLSQYEKQVSEEEQSLVEANNQNMAQTNSVDSNSVNYSEAPQQGQYNQTMSSDQVANKYLNQMRSGGATGGFRIDGK